MASVVATGITFDTNSGTKTVTLTPQAGELIVVITANTGQTAAPTVTDDNSSGTYTALSTSTLKGGSADAMFVFMRDALILSTTSTIFSMAPGVTTGGGLCVLRVSGMTQVGANAARAAAKQANQGAATPAPVFGQAVLTTNTCVGAIFNATNPATMTPPASWTEQQDVGYAGPATGLQVSTRDSGETGSTITWGSASGSSFGSIAVELDSTASPGGAIFYLKA